MFKLKLQKIKANEWRTYTGYQSELKKGHVIRIQNDDEVYVIDQVVTDKRSGLSAHYIRLVIPKRGVLATRVILEVNSGYRIIGQQ
jgi:hypothetical protein